MAPYKYRECQTCHTPRTDEMHLNAKGNCLQCSIKAATDASRQMHERSGPYFERWQAAMVRASGLTGPRGVVGTGDDDLAARRKSNRSARRNA